MIITDHKALEYFGTKRLLNERQIRWIGILSQFHFQITYRPGKENAIADILSRKDELTPTQKAAKEAEKMRTVLPPEVTLASVGTQDGQDEAFAKNPIEDLKVIKETL